MLSSFALACDTVFRRGLAFAGQLPPNAEVFGDGDGTVPITIQQGKKRSRESGYLCVYCWFRQTPSTQQVHFFLSIAWMSDLPSSVMIRLSTYSERVTTPS